MAVSIERHLGIISLDEPHYIIDEPTVSGIFILVRNPHWPGPDLPRELRKNIDQFEALSLDHIGSATLSGLLGPDYVSFTQIYCEEASKKSGFGRIIYEGYFDQGANIYRGNYRVDERPRHRQGIFEMRRLLTGTYS